MQGFLDRFDAGFERVTRYLIYLVALSIGLFAFLIPLNLLLIKAHWGSFWWLYEAVEYALYVGVFLGAPWVLRQGAHVKVDVLTAALPRNLAVRLEQALDVAGAVLCLLLCFYGTRMMIWEFQDGTLPDKDLRIPTGYMMLVFGVSFLLLAVEFLLRCRRAGAAAEERSAESGF